MAFHDGTDACFYNVGVIRGMRADLSKSCGKNGECSRCGWNPAVSACRIEKIRSKMKTAVRKKKSKQN